MSMALQRVQAMSILRWVVVIGEAFSRLDILSSFLSISRFDLLDVIGEGSKT
jgi:hypothetical protein